MVSFFFVVVVHVLNVCFTIVCEIRIRYKQVCVCVRYICIYIVYEYIYHKYINVIFIFGLWIDWCVNTHVCHIVIVVVPHVQPHTHKAVQREGKHMCVGCCVFFIIFLHLYFYFCVA